MSEIGKRLGQRIRELRTQRAERWTQEDLAERARISVSFLSMIERAERVPHVETLVVLAKCLGVTLSQIFDGVSESRQDNNVLLPLTVYLERLPLSSGDVEALVLIARTMFKYKS